MACQWRQVATGPEIARKQFPGAGVLTRSLALTAAYLRDWRRCFTLRHPRAEQGA